MYHCAWHCFVYLAKVSQQTCLTNRRISSKKSQKSATNTAKMSRFVHHFHRIMQPPSFHAKLCYLHFLAHWRRWSPSSWGCVTRTTAMTIAPKTQYPANTRVISYHQCSHRLRARYLKWTNQLTKWTSNTPKAKYANVIAFFQSHHLDSYHHLNAQAVELLSPNLKLKCETQNPFKFEPQGLSMNVLLKGKRWKKNILPRYMLEVWMAEMVLRLLR